MQRKLISNLPLSDMLGGTFAFVVISWAVLSCLVDCNWLAASILSLFYIELAWLAMRPFGSKHKVYFDDAAVYWGRQALPLSAIQKLTYRNRGRWVYITYTDTQNKTRTIHFYNDLTFFDEVLTWNNLIDLRKLLEEKYPAVEIRFMKWWWWK